MEIYSVRRGDNLYSISKIFNVNMKSITDINGLTEAEILAEGMNLVIPAIATISYKVASGDTLWSIGNKYNVDYIKILTLNNLNTNSILSVGQILKIPIESLTHTVQPGDFLWAIAQRYNINASTIIALNNLQYPYLLYIGQILLLSDKRNQKPTIETLAYYNPTSVKNKTSIIDTLGKYLTYLGIFDFPITTSGEIIGELDPNILASARLKNVTVLPVLTNLVQGKFDSNLAETVLSNISTLNNLINNVIILLKKYNLKGINIDFENLYSKDRDLYTQFIRLLSSSLHKNNKILVVNIAPKWEDWPEKDWVGFFDYNAIGPYIDIAAIMTYEWGWRDGPPRPTAPIKFVKQSLDYALANNIPRSKILMGLTLYGYNWELPYTPENLATAVILSEVWDLAKAYNSTIRFDSVAKQPNMDYISTSRIQHEIWFEDVLSHYIKYQIVKDYGLRGVFYWVLPQAFPSTWYVLSNTFIIKKYIT